MNLHALLRRRAERDEPLRVGLIGAGKFGSMYLAQAPRTPGVHIAAIADLNPDGARAALARVGWPPETYAAPSLAAALARGTTWIGDDPFAPIAAPEIDIVIDATGDPAAGVAHVLACCEHGTDVVMVNVEADALVGPALAARAADAGIVYSLAYGDQPALVCEMVDWARAAGFEVVAAGKGTKHLPAFHRSTPDTVWEHYGLSAEEARAGGMNPRMFNSFLDGTKSAIEMAAIANACALDAPSDGLAFPPCEVDALADVLRPREIGGALERHGQVEVVSSLARDGTPLARDLRWGVYVVFAAGGASGAREYVRRCFREYGLATDATGEYAAMYKPYHLIGLELGISVASVGLRREPTGAPLAWRADVVATAKRDLAAGETLDGEGGYRVYGKLLPASRSLALGALPLGLAHGATLRRDVAADEAVRWGDVEIDEGSEAVRLRREMERDGAAGGSGH